MPAEPAANSSAVTNLVRRLQPSRLMTARLITGGLRALKNLARAASAAAGDVESLIGRMLEQEEFERLGRLKSNFIALASHELRAPATIVHGIATTLDARADFRSNRRRTT